MSKYLIEFEKTGLMQFISHLDLQRLFRRTVRRLGYNLEYSKGFNPHPKLAMAQPLSLGYEGKCEVMELEIREDIPTEELMSSINGVLPEGIRILRTRPYPENVKSFGAKCQSAIYEITYPEKVSGRFSKSTIEEFLAQEKITAFKRQKKTKKLVEISIKDKIREINLVESNILRVHLDCGSVSNLSPEQLIEALEKYFNLDCKREEIRVSREKLFFDVDFPI